MKLSEPTDFCETRHQKITAQGGSYKSLTSLSLALLLFTVAGCGGGSGSDTVDADVPIADVPGPLIPDGDDIPVDDDVVVIDENPSLARFTVSGSLTANDALQVDSDVNDPLTVSFDNNTLVTAQPISNPAVVKGFVTGVPTGFEGDRFAETADVFDFFSISAFANQSVLMETADFDPGAPADIDLDIGLFDQTGALLIESASVANSFEAFVIPADGNYFIGVRAFSGSSNYTLTVSTEFSDASFESQVFVGDVRLDQLTLARQPTNVDNVSFLAQMGRSAEFQGRSISQPVSIAMDSDATSMATLFANQRNGGAASGATRKTMSSMQTGTVTGRASTTLDVASMLETIKVMNSKEGDDVFMPVDYRSTLQDAGSDPVPSPLAQWNLHNIGWIEAQDQLQNIAFQKSPVLAVIDSGFFVGHPDLAGVFIDQRDFVPALIDGDGLVADASDDVNIGDDPSCHSFHGTHVSTTAVAPQNNVGITGVAPGIGLIGIKVGHNTGPRCGIFGDIANAVLYAAGLPNSSGSVPPTPADVINLSLGGRLQDPQVVAAIGRAVAEGVIVVAAAGNDGAPVRSFPAANDNVIAVAATDLLNQRSPFSSFYAEIDIAAPGGDLRFDRNGDGRADGIVAGIASISGSEFQASYSAYQGTSMASPTVAAGIALMKGIEPSLTQSDIERLLAAGELTVDIESPGFDNETGFGLMSIPKMIESAQQFTGDENIVDAATVVTSTPASVEFGASLNSVSVNLVQLGNDNVSVVSITGSDSLRLPDGTFLVSFAAPDSDNGFGTYSFAIDRGALEEGSVSGSLTFNLSNETTYEVPVSAVNQLIDGRANSAAVFFIIERLISEDVFEPLPEQFQSFDGIGEQILTSPELPEGTYRMVYGTDTDNDFLICDEGELCGSFPFRNFGFDATFTLDSNISGATYLLQDVANISFTSLSGSPIPAITPRRVSKNQTLTTD